MANKNLEGKLIKLIALNNEYVIKSVYKLISIKKKAFLLIEKSLFYPF